MAISAEQQIDLKINNLTRAIYNELQSQGKIASDQLYAVSDDSFAVSSDVDARLEDYALTSDIPTVNDAQITIKQGNDVKGTFTLNQSNNLTVELSAGGSGGGGDAVWGSITGTLSAQSDLKSEFDRVDSAINGKVVWKNWD